MKLFTCSQKRLLTTALSILIFALIAYRSPESYAAQGNIPELSREKLLNNLDVLFLYRPSDTTVSLNLRIRGGAAFDLAGKEGTMALLGDALFPDQSAREYVEELGGRVEVTTDYDWMDISLSSRAAEFERVVTLLRNTLVNPPLIAETFAQLRAARIKVLRETSVAPETSADRALMARLFGDYPYGRPAAGTPETLARVERADVLFARERFLNPNNSTLLITGNIEPRRAMRALRQFLGSWRKSENVVPATFRQPVAPDTRTLIINLPGAASTEVRLAVRGVARGSDRNAAAALLLTFLARERWLAALPELRDTAFSVRHDAYGLAGIFRMGAALPAAPQAAKALAAARAVLQTLAAAQATAAEVDRAKRDAVALLKQKSEQPGSLAKIWLDAETYRLSSPSEAQIINGLTPADLQRSAAQLFRDAPVATIAIGDAAQLQAEIVRTNPVQIVERNNPVVSETAPPQPPPKPASTAQPIKRPY